MAQQPSQQAVRDMIREALHCGPEISQIDFLNSVNAGRWITPAQAAAVETIWIKLRSRALRKRSRR